MRNYHKRIKKKYSLSIKMPLILFASMFCIMQAFAQQKVTGKVQDKDGTPIAGVNILLKTGGSVGTTDLNGVFSISTPDLQQTLRFQHVGYESMDVNLNNKPSIQVQLTPLDNALDEVVVTGYSSQQKKDITGSVTVVDMKAIDEQSAVSADRALQGLASGVNVVSSGIPGSASQITIRGLSSFGDTKPLIIVDGIEQNLTHVNPNDIESMQVLKDAGAAAIYGVRGANGVIIVTTKKGKSGQPSIQLESSLNINYPLAGNVFDLMNSTDYMNAYNIAFPGNPLFKDGMPDYVYRGPNGAGVGMEGDPAVDPSLYFYEKRNTGKNYIIQKVNKDREDWFHNLFKRALTHQHNASINGGNENAKYFFGLGIVDQKGTLHKSFYERYSGRVNTEFKIGKYIKIGENLSLNYRKNPSVDNQSEFGLIGSTFKMLPITPLTDIMGNWGGTYGGPNLGTFANPIALQERNVGKDLNSDWGIAGNTFAEVDVLSDFKFRTSLGVNYNNYFDRNFTATQTENVQASSNYNSLSISSGYSNTLTFTNTLNYDKKFAKHTIHVLAGTEYIKFLSRGVNGSVSALFSEDENYLSLNNGTLNLANSSSTSSNSLFSIFGRADYSYDNKYMASATIRRDGSSKFGPNNRFGVFPSFSLGWRVSEENFLKDVAWINDLKLKGSWGILGSQNNVDAANAYSLYASSLSSSYYDLNGSSTSVIQGFRQSRIGNMATGWERNIVTNTGFDLTVLDNRLSISAEYYNKKINGLLFTESLPAVIIGGATAPTINIGDIQNKGIDFTANYTQQLSTDFSFNVGVNITTYKNKIIDIPSPGYFDSGSFQSLGRISRNEEGHAMSSFYGYQIIGLFNTAEEIADAPTQTAAQVGRFRYQDTNNDGSITADDRTYLGDPNPDFTYGLNLGFKYKQFDFSSLFYGSQGNDIYNTTLGYLDFMQYYAGAKSNRLKDAWTPENMNTTVPKIESATSFSTNGTSNSYFIEDGSFLKLRNISLGYTLNSSKLQKIGIQKLRLFTQAHNLFTWTRYSGLDPELVGSPSDFGIDLGNYPNNEMSLIFGLNLNF